VGWAQTSFVLSQRRACSALGVNRSSVRYVSCQPLQAPLRQRLHELAASRISYGYRRLHVLLRREGWAINHKRVYRLYRDEGLVLRRKRPRRRRSAVRRQERHRAERPNQVWSMDFMSDALADGRKLRVLTVLDTYSRECVALKVKGHFRGEDVAQVLDAARRRRGGPEMICVDNGPEFTSVALDMWAWKAGVKLDFSRPGKPGDNALIESFNARVRQECLSQHYFINLQEARQVLKAWREDYNNHRPHSALQGRSPAEFRAWLSCSEGSNKAEYLPA